MGSKRHLYLSLGLKVLMGLSTLPSNTNWSHYDSNYVVLQLHASRQQNGMKQITMLSMLTQPKDGGRTGYRKTRR